MSELKALRWAYLGRLDYESSTRLQERIRQRLREKTTCDHLLLLEHDHVYTLGRSASTTDVLASASWLGSQGIDVVESDRGGQVTYHGPGQLVGYPVIDLNPDRRDVRRYVGDLQRVLVEALAELGVEARGETRQSLIGVWVGPQKIASIGVHLSRWIATHGFALNVSTDLDYFDRIVPCGLPGVRMASIESVTGRAPDLADVAAIVAERFARRFGRRLESAESSDLLRLSEADGVGDLALASLVGEA